MKQTITINLKRAAFDRQSVTIAGGIFGPDELKKAAEAIERAPEASELIKEPAATKAKHTPGPWMHSFESTDPAWAVVTTLRGDIVANVNSETGPDIPPLVSVKMPKEANARLIAAAPEMLEALRVLVKWMDDSGQSHAEPAAVGTMLQTEPVEYSVVTDARNAIRKATGAE